MEDTKLCTKCKTVKNFTNFPFDKRRVDGLGSWCRQCVSKAGLDWAKRNKGRNLSLTRKWIENNKERYVET